MARRRFDGANGLQRYSVGLCYPTTCRYQPNLAGAVGCPLPGETQARSQFHGTTALRIETSLVDSFHLDLHFQLLPISASCSKLSTAPIFGQMSFSRHDLVWRSLDNTTGRLFDKPLCLWRAPPSPCEEIDGRRNLRARESLSSSSNASRIIDRHHLPPFFGPIIYRIPVLSSVSILG